MQQAMQLNLILLIFTWAERRLQMSGDSSCLYLILVSLWQHNVLRGWNMQLPLFSNKWKSEDEMKSMKKVFAASQNGGCNSTCAVCIYHIDFHQKTGREEVPWRPILNVTQYPHHCIASVQIVACWKKYVSPMTLIFFPKDTLILPPFLLFSGAYHFWQHMPGHSFELRTSPEPQF